MQTIHAFIHTEMTTKQAVELRTRWNQQANLFTCEHLTLELEYGEGGDPTANYICIVCGEHVVTKR
ncbi:hypothetical protein YTPLAS72_34500 [Nitrospira sp.]|nr:hypothetical protein YTPLAS72_34500 [Nitrospira sp.]